MAASLAGLRSKKPPELLAMCGCEGAHSQPLAIGAEVPALFLSVCPRHLVCGGLPESLPCWMCCCSHLEHERRAGDSEKVANREVVRWW